MVNAAKKKNEGYSQSKYYLGFLVCRGAPRALGEGSTVHLPVLLCCGTVRTTKAVHFLLQKFFDCSISAIKLSQEDLAWLCALQADEKGTSKETSQVEMVFTFPHLSVKNTIQFKIPLQSLKYLWERYVCMSVFMCVCACACVCARVRVCVCICMYAFMHNAKCILPLDCLRKRLLLNNKTRFVCHLKVLSCTYQNIPYRSFRVYVAS